MSLIINSPVQTPQELLKNQFLSLWGKKYEFTAAFIHEKLIPKGFESFEMSEHPNYKGDENVRNFTITYPSDIKGSITKVEGAWGWKPAKGMKITAKKIIQGTFYGLKDTEKDHKIVFADHTLVLNPGKMFPNARLLEMTIDGENVILTAAAKGVKPRAVAWHYFSLIDTCKDLKWG